MNSINVFLCLWSYTVGTTFSYHFLSTKHDEDSDLDLPHRMYMHFLVSLPTAQYTVGTWTVMPNSCNHRLDKPVLLSKSPAAYGAGSTLQLQALPAGQGVAAAQERRGLTFCIPFPQLITANREIIGQQQVRGFHTWFGTAGCSLLLNSFLED